MTLLIWVLSAQLATFVAILWARRWRGRLRIVTQLAAVYVSGGVGVLTTAALANFYSWNKSDLLGIIGLAISIVVTAAASNRIREINKLRIAIVIPSMRPFHKELRRGVYEAALAGQYTVFDPYNDRDSPEEDLTTFGLCLNAAIRGRADGLIVCAPAIALAESRDLQRECTKFATKGGHIVFIESVPGGEFLDSLRFATTLTSDSEAGSDLLAKFIAQFVEQANSARPATAGPDEGVRAATGPTEPSNTKIVVLPGPAHSRPAAQRLGGTAGTFGQAEHHRAAYVELDRERGAGIAAPIPSQQ